jgi:hypothetical protein
MMNYDEYGRRVAKAYEEYRRYREDITSYTRKARRKFDSSVALEKASEHNKAYNRLFNTLDELEMLRD